MHSFVKYANSAFNQGRYSEALSFYLKAQRTYPEFSRLFDVNIELCRNRISESFGKVSITMTTISERLHLIEPVIESILSQTLKPHEVIINVSEDPYLLDKGVRKNNPVIKSIEAFPLIKINWVENTGPHRKIIPFLERFFKSGQVEHQIFITVDDDTIYPDYFVQTLVDEFFENDSVIAFRGRKITLEEGFVSSYDKWSNGTPDLSLTNLPTGKDGIIYSTKFFTEEFVNIDKALELTPTADDLWIKWHCALNGVKAKILNPEATTSDYKSFPVVDYSSAYRDVSLYKAHNSISAGGKNDKSVSALESYFKSIYGYNLSSLCRLEGE